MSSEKHITDNTSQITKIKIAPMQKALKVAILRCKIKKIYFLGGGTAPFPFQTPAPSGEGNTFPQPTPSAPSRFSPTALELGALS